MREKRRSIIANFGESVCKVISSGGPGNKSSVGTGFFVATEGILLTSNHVVSYFEPDQKGNIRHHYFPRVDVEIGGKRVHAEVINDKNSTHPIFEDYAILKAEINNISPIPVGNYDEVETGDDVLILGFPFGLPELCATSGIISTKYRSPSVINNLVIIDMLRIDASINVGNSGGPVVDLHSSKAVAIVSLRMGDISPQIMRLREQTEVPRDLIDVLEASNRFLNVGIGEAISINYALNELRGSE